MIEDEKVTLYRLELFSIDACMLASPIQIISLHVVVLEHPQQLDVLANEAGRQQAVGPQLETLLQGESHALRTHANHHKIVYAAKSR